MPGSKITSTLDEMHAARERGELQTDWARVEASGDFVWDGEDEDERPLSREEMLAGITQSKTKRGRSTGNGKKVSVTVRLDADIVAAFRATGPGWQTRLNDALREWLKEHTSGLTRT